MKQNKIFRLSAILLVLTLLSTCVISGTFAKYTTSYDASDTATVAKWGITLTVSGDDVLYDDGKTGNEVTGNVVTNNSLTAPGTYQKLATVALTGTPEVAYKITVNVDLDLGENWTTTGSDVYCPLVFTVDGTPYKIDGTYDTVEKLELAIEEAIIIAITGGDASTKTVGSGAYANGYTDTEIYNAGTAVPTTANAVLIDWTWAFEGNDDAKDTILGNAANATVNFKLAVTVEQVDAI